MSTITTINATDKPRLSREVINTNFANLNSSKAETADVALLAGAYADPSWITSLAWAKITGVPATYAPSAHTHPFTEVTGSIANAQVPASAVTQHQAALALAASQITSGALALARGGTGADLSASGGAGYVLKQSSAGAAVTVAALVASDIPSLDTAKITTGTFADARIAASNVTQHQAALSVLASQISDRATNLVTSLTGTPNRVTVSAANGAITITGPQDLHTAATPTFAGLTSPSLTYAGTLALSATGANVITMSTNGTEWARVSTSGLSLRANPLLFDSFSGGSNFIQGSVTDTGGTKTGIDKAWMFQSRYDDIVLQAGINDSNTRTITLRSGLTKHGLSVTTLGNVLVGTTTDDGASKLQVAGNIYAFNAGVSLVKAKNTSSTADAYFHAENTAGTAYFGVNSAGAYIYSVGNFPVGLYTNGQKMLDLSGAGTLTLYNPTNPTGVTQAVIRAGAGQGTTSLLVVQESGGATRGEWKLDSLRVGSLLSTADALIKVGDGRTGDGNSYLDFIGDATYTTYGLRITRGAGANGDTYIANRGTGSLYLQAQDAGAVNVFVNGGSKFKANTTGIGFFGVTPVARQTATDLASVIALLQAYGLSN